MFRGTHRRPAKLIAFAFALTLGWAVSAGATPAAADTTVSLTFLGGSDDQYQARSILSSHGMDGTFYVSSGRIGQAGRLTWQQVNDLASDGNEIGGQTVDDVSLSGLSPTELQHQICDDRTALINRGFAPVSFAYPHGSGDANAAAQAQVQACGYVSGRGDTGLGAFGQPKGESIPPANPMLLRAPGTVGDTTDLEQLEDWVANAEQQGNAWLPLAFANVCNPATDSGCPASHITPSDLDSFLTWLQGRSLTGTHVKTVRKVMTGTDPPPTPFQGTTISLTFGSAIDNQYATRQILLDHDMQGTFYVNSGRVGLGGRLTWSQVHDLASDGNEIGGQTINNPTLTGLDPTELAHQICDDRTALQDKGYAPVSFAWPHGSSDAPAAAMSQVQQCGYASARGDTGLGGTGQPNAESIPPQNPYLLRTRGSIDQDDTLSEIESWITQAEQAGNGWFPIAFSNVCDPATDGAACPTSHITPQDLDALLDWIEARESEGLRVEPVRQVMTGTTQPEPAPLPGTTVSITFDDGNADQMAAKPILAAHGMPATFYIITGRVGTPSYFTWNQVESLYDDGNEIGGHTVHHLHLPTLSEAQQRDEICDARDDLLARGYPQLSFAYPFGDHDATSEALVQECGYLSGRGVSGLGGTGEPKAETIPPRDPWVVRTRGSVDVNDTLAEVEDWITDAEHVGNGWMNLVFHHICDPNVTNCADPNGVADQYMTPSDFDALLDWLQARESLGTEVRTIGDVMENATPPDVDNTAPVTQIKCDGAACQAAYNHPVTVSLSASDTGGSTLKEIHYTVDGSLPTGSSPVYTGPFTVSGAVQVRFRASDNAGNVEPVKSQQVIVDATAPTSSALCDGASCASGYNHTVSVTLPASDNPGGSGVKNVRYTTNGSTPTGSSPIYTGPFNVSSTATVKFRAEDNVGNVESPVNSQTITIDTAKPTSSIQCNGTTCSASYYTSAVSATLSATDTGGSGVKNIRYTTDGTSPTSSSPVYSGPINVGSTTTIQWRAEDNAGNVESPVNSRTIQVDTAKPSSSILCDGGPCSASGYNHSVSATLSGTDTGGSGLKNIRYTTDGTDPTGASPVYSAPIPVSATTTIKFRAEDNAGNVESPVHAQVILIDSSPPSTQISCDGGACSTGFNHLVSVNLAATDNAGGSGVKEIRYTTDGSDPTTSSTLYTGAFHISSTKTVKFRAEDNAGNLESPKSQLILIETQAPTSSILCDGVACSNGFYNHSVSATLSGTDSGGSGLKNIRYTTDGSDPTGSSQVYSGPINVGSTTTIKWRAEDNAGNVESPVNSQTIQVDTAKPTSSILCDGAACLASGYSHAVSATLSATDSGGSDLKEIRYTVDGSDPTGSSPVYSSPIPVNATTTIKFRAEDNAGNVESPVNSQTIVIDTANPTSSIQCDAVACSDDFYNHSVSATLSGNDTGGAGLKSIRYTTNGSDPTASSPVYGAPITVNATTTIKFRAEDNAGNVESPIHSQTISIDTANPASAIQCDGAGCASTFYNHAVSATLSGSDTGGSGLKNIRYTTDGTDPTGSSPVYSGTIPVNSTTTIKWRAEDNAGNLESPVNSQTIKVDTANPSSSIRCNAAACSTGFYNGSVSVTLSGSDSDGSDVKEIRYTLDGSAPTSSSALYTDPINVASTTTIKWRAEDNAGNLESPVNTQTISIDTANPTSSIQCDAATCSTGFYNHAVSATLSGSDTGGSSLKNIRYTTDGSDPTGSSPVYTNPIPVNDTTTIKWRAEDNAGNVESPINSQTISIDTAKPTSSILCDGTACSNDFYNHPVSTTLSGNDTGGSGLNGIRYTTDGTDPDSSSQLIASGGQINVDSTTTIKWRAEDDADNLESPVNSQTVKVDTTDPTSSIECDGGTCSTSFYNQPVSVTLSGDDGEGSGLKNIRYTTDGSTPDGSSTLYTAPIPVSATTTIKFRAEDNFGHVESPVNSQTIQIDTAKPSSSIKCGGAVCQPSYDHSIDVILSATDTGGSDVKEIRYTTDGSAPTASSPIYSGPIPVNATTTIKFRAEDNAGNVESPVNSQAIQIVPPPDPGPQGAQLDVSSMQSKPNGSAKLTFTVNGPGNLQADDALVAGASAVAAKKRSPNVKPTSRSVAQPGEVTLTIHVSKTGKRILRRKGRLTVPVRVTFTPATGSPTERTVKVKFRLKLKR